MLRRTFLQSALALRANDKINVAFIGTGGRGGDGLIVDFLRHADCRAVAVCDTFLDRRQRRAAQIEAHYLDKGVAQFADFRQLLARPDIDAVAIATPDHWHVPIAVAAARAGKAVYVEKPLGLTVQQNQILRDTIRKTGRVFQYGTQQRGASHIRIGCELVRSGAIGKLTALEVVSPSGAPGGNPAPAPIPAGFDYEMWQGPAPARPFSPDRAVTPGHYHISDYSIGYLGGWGAHPLDVLDWALPWPDVPVEYVAKGLVPTQGLFDTVMDWDATCRYRNGLTLRFKAGPEDSTTFTGEGGAITIRRAGISSNPPSLTAGIPVTRFAAFGRNHTRNFLDAIRGQLAPESPIDSAFRTDLISHLTNIAVRTGRKITWDPDKETITGDPAAAALLHRPLRSPWTL